jgi:hypothetical protein
MLGEEIEMRARKSGVTAASIIACAGAWLSTASAANTPPDFAPDAGTAWVSRGQDFLPPPGGPGPVSADPKRPRVTNDDLRAGTGQPLRAMADLSNPILQPWAREELKKRNDLVLSGDYAATPKERCWPIGVPGFLLYPVQPVYFVQTPKEIVLMWAEDHQVRHIYMNVPHSPQVTPSWFGESVGHYEDDTLVVDTIGLNTRTFIDSFLTPHTDKLHVVERFHIVDGGKAMEVQVHVEDPGAFTTPWNAMQRYRRVDEKGKATDVRQMGGPIEEMACAENNRGIGPIPAATTPDF